VQPAGLPSPEPYGVVELTTEREYLIVFEFIDGAKEIGEAEVDDQGLGLVRRLWEPNLAHRDIKPANLLVRDGKLYLIEVFFAQVNPSPRRQTLRHRSNGRLELDPEGVGANISGSGDAPIGAG
jgi:tRNA A-37 threonylcarbamoyl transferase component Bud32